MNFENWHWSRHKKKMVEPWLCGHLHGAVVKVTVMKYLNIQKVHFHCTWAFEIFIINWISHRYCIVSNKNQCSAVCANRASGTGIMHLEIRSLENNFITAVLFRTNEKNET